MIALLTLLDLFSLHAAPIHRLMCLLSEIHIFQVYSMQQYNIHAVGYPPLLKWFTEHTKEMHNPPNDAWKVGHLKLPTP